MYVPLRGLCASIARFLNADRRDYAFRIVRIPKNPETNGYRRLHPDLIAPEDLRHTNRAQLLRVYEALGDSKVRVNVDNDYVESLLNHTVSLKLSLLPEDYALVFKIVRRLSKLPPGCIAELNEGIRRLSSNFNHKQIAIIIRSYATLSSRSITTITELLKSFNKNIDEAEVWHLRELVSALATLRIQPTGVVETLYKNTVSIIQKHLKSMHADDIGVFLNSFSRQRINHDEILHFVDIHARRLIHEASYRNVALITNAFARAEKYSPQLMKAVTDRLHKEMHSFLSRQSEYESLIIVNQPSVKDIRDGSTTANLVDASGDCEAPSPVEWISSAEKATVSSGHLEASSGSSLNIIDVAMIFNALTKLENNCEKLLNMYIPWLNHHVNTDTPTLSLVLIAHAYSHAGVRDSDLFNRVAHVIIRRVNSLNCQQLGLIALSFARTGQNIPVLFLRIADEIIYRGTVALKFKRYHFDFQSLEHLMQAFSRIGFKDQRLYSVLTTLMRHRLRIPDGDELHGDMIASMLASMAHHKVDGFVPLITDAIVRSKDSTAYSTPALCKVVSAFSRLNVRHSKILDFMLKETKDRVNEFQIPVLVNTLKALAKLRCYNLTLLRESLKRCSLHLAHLSTHDIANLLSALNDYSFRNVSFLQKLILCIKYRMAEFNRNQLHIVFTRLAMLRTSDTNLYQNLTHRLMEKQHEFNEVQLADIATGYLYVLVHFDYLQRAMKTHPPSQDMEFGRYQQTSEKMAESDIDRSTGVYVSTIEGARSSGNYINSQAGDDHRYNEGMISSHCPKFNLIPYGFNDNILDAMLSHLGTKLDVATIFKVQTIHLYLEHVRTDIYKRLSKRALDVLRKCSSVNFPLAEYMITSSSVHRELSHFLNLMGVLHRNEVQFGPYLIDIVPETSSNKRVAIEYDGPTHFYAETIMRTAKSILKHEILENTGWQVIHVPYQEWAQLVSSKQKIIYLNNIRTQYEGSHTTASPQSVLGFQKRTYSSGTLKMGQFEPYLSHSTRQEASSSSSDQ